jgi:PAS domain S-box-containing protein
MKPRLLLFVLTLLAVLMPLGWWAGEARARIDRLETEQKLTRVALGFADTLNPVLVRKLGFGPEPGDPSATTRIEGQMRLALDALDLDAIRGMKLDHGRLRSGPFMKKEPEGQSRHPSVDTAALEPAVLAIYRNRQPVVIHHSGAGDATGWTVLAPVVDSWNGELLMVVGLDYRAPRQASLLGDPRIKSLLVMLAMALLIGTGFSASFLMRRDLKKDPLKLRKWILGPVSVAMAAGVLFLITSQIHSFRTQAARDAQSVIDGINRDWERQYSAFVGRFESKVEDLGYQTQLAEAVAQGGQARIAALATKTYRRLKENFQIDQLLLAGQDHRILYRVHAPERFGDKVEHAGLQAASATDEDAWGIELYLTGDLVMRYVHPLRHAGHTVGYLELGLEIETLLNRAFAGSRYDYLVLADKEIMRFAQVEAGRGSPDLSAFQEIGNSLIILGSDNLDVGKDILSQLTIQGSQAEEQKFFQFTKGGSTYACGVVDLSNAQGQVVAQILAFQDLTTEYNNARASVTLNAALLLSISISLLALLWQTTSESEAALRSSFEEIRSLGERYRIVADHTYAWECWYAPDGSLVYSSPSCEQITGYRADEFNGDTDLLLTLAHPQDRQRVAEHFAGLGEKKDGSTCEFDVRIKAKDGSTRIISHICKQIYGEEGRYLGRRSSNYDVTRQREADARLRVLSRAMEQSPVTIVITDVQGAIEFVNPKFTETTGYTAGEALGKNPRILNSGYTKAEEYEELWRTILSGSNWKGVFRNKRKDGSLYWEEAIISPVKDEGGAIQHILAIKEDISERKELERRLKLQAQAMDNASGYIIIADATKPDLPVIYVNLAFERITGYSRQDVMGKNCRFLQGQDRTQSGLEEIRKSLREGRACQALLRNYRKDGSLYWNDISLAPVRNAEGVITYYIGISNDITELMRIQAELLENEERLRTTQEFANIGSWDWNIQTGTIRWAANVARLFGLPRGKRNLGVEEFLAKVHPEDHKVVTDAIQRCLDTGEQYQCEHRCVWPDGSIHWLQETGNIIRDQSGPPVQMLGMAQDITDRKRTELALIESREAADRASKAKSEFLSLMSHELRTPMNAILGFGQLLEMDGNLTSTQSDFISEIMKAGHHLLDLINDILDLSRVETGRLELTLEAVPCDELVQECLVLVRSLAGTNEVSLSHGIIPETCVLADKVRLKQILVNLLSNAIKYNHKQGMVRVACSVIVPTVRFEVLDTGQGIPEERMAELFQPFNRLGAEKGTIEGTGIGLTISRNLVEKMGGRIGVRSSPGEGSMFWVELPLATEYPGGIPGEKPVEEGSHGNRHA